MWGGGEPLPRPHVRRGPAASPLCQQCPLRWADALVSGRTRVRGQARPGAGSLGVSDAPHPDPGYPRATEPGPRRPLHGQDSPRHSPSSGAGLWHRRCCGCLSPCKRASLKRRAQGRPLATCEQSPREARVSWGKPLRGHTGGRCAELMAGERRARGAGAGAGPEGALALTPECGQAQVDCVCACTHVCMCVCARVSMFLCVSV